MRRRHKGSPGGQEAESIAQIEIIDLDAMDLSELAAESQEPQGKAEPEGMPWKPPETADRSWVPTVEELEAEIEKGRHRSRYSRTLRSTCFSLLVVAAAAVLIAVLLLPVLKIDGTSMTDTLQDGDIVVALSGTRFRTGDVIAFYYNNSILVKRVIATAGDWVDIDGEGNVYVNGEAIEEPYLAEKALGRCDIDLPYQVPDGKCFVMGDHRSTSIDSRSASVGCIGTGSVVGRIALRIWPVWEIGLID